MKWLTKSDYTHGFLVAPALLWIRKHQPDRLPPVDEGLQYRFEVGSKLTELARRRWEDGHLVSEDTLKSLDATKAAMGKHNVLFEAAVLAPADTTAVTGKQDRLYARADIVVKNGDAWDMYEVKSAASYHRHPEYLLDLAFQKIVWERAGLKVGKLHLVLVNTKYQKQGEVDPGKLFYVQDVTDAIPELIGKVEANIKAALEIIDRPTCPALDPLDCDNLSRWLPIYEHLAGALPEESIFRLGFISKSVAQKLKNAGIENIADIKTPGEFKLSPAQHGQWLAFTGGPQIKGVKIANYLQQLRYPLYFLDYETVAPAIPLYDGTRPYQTVPFQYSIQVIDTPGKAPRELKYLHTGKDNPMPQLIKHLEQDIGQSGSILVWSGYERSVHQAVAAHYPEHKDFFKGLNKRLFDLMQVFRLQMYVDAAFYGSSSIKKVLPVLVPSLNYKDLNITEGQAASSRWEKTVTGQISGEEAKQVFTDLITYCGQDTLAMVKIYEILDKTASQAMPKLAF